MTVQPIAKPTSGGQPRTGQGGCSQDGTRPIDLAAATSALELPTYAERLPILSERLVSDGYPAVVLIDLSDVSKIAHGRGNQSYDRLMELLGRELVRLHDAELRRKDLLALGEKAGDAILVFLAAPYRCKPLDRKYPDTPPSWF